MIFLCFFLFSNLDQNKMEESFCSSIMADDNESNDPDFMFDDKVTSSEEDIDSDFDLCLDEQFNSNAGRCFIVYDSQLKYLLRYCPECGCRIDESLIQVYLL